VKRISDPEHKRAIATASVEAFPMFRGQIDQGSRENPRKIRGKSWGESVIFAPFLSLTDEESDRRNGISAFRHLGILSHKADGA
jgi:hypothetical protein